MEREPDGIWFLLGRVLPKSDTMEISSLSFHSYHSKEKQKKQQLRLSWFGKRERKAGKVFRQNRTN